MQLLSFDIEISDVFELGKHEDMGKYAPFHISVAATAVHGGEERVWYSEQSEGHPALNLSRESLRSDAADGSKGRKWNFGDKCVPKFNLGTRRKQDPEAGIAVCTPTEGNFGY